MSEISKCLDAFVKKNPKLTKKDSGIIRIVQMDSPQLNYLFGGGIPIGRIHRLRGPSSGGKSVISIYEAAQIQRKLPELLNKPDKNIVIYVDFERTFSTKFAEEIGLDCSEDKFIHLLPDDIETATDVLVELIKLDKIVAVIFDSDGAAPSRTAMTDPSGKANFGSNAKALSEMLKKINIVCGNYDTTMFLISQERVNMNVMSHLPACVSINTEFKSDGISLSLKDIIKKTKIKYETSIGVPFDISNFNIEVASFNTDTQKIENKKITQIIYQGKRPVYKIVPFNNFITRILYLTPDHPIWDILKKEYVGVENFEGESLWVDGTNVKLKIEQTDKVEHVFDIEVEDNHNFFANSILIKNCTGGEAPQFYASTVNRVTKIDVIKRGNETIGQQIRVRNYKNKTSIPFRDAVVNLYYKGGFKPEEEYLDFFISFGLFKQGGAWYTHPEYGKFNGRAKIQEWLAEHPVEFELMRKEVDSLLCKETDLDKNNADPEKEPDDDFSVTENDLEEEI